MQSRFFVAMIAMFVAVLTTLGAVGLVIARSWVSAPRDVYRNAAFEFDLAPGWWCQTGGTEDVCYPERQKPHAAGAIIAFKYRNDTDDNLDAFERHLRQPRRVEDRDGQPGELSRIQYVRRVTLGGREWVEGLHEGSEVPGYNTLYLATVTSHAAILVTMSVHRNYVDRYTNEFSGMIKSLKTYQR